MTGIEFALQRELGGAWGPPELSALELYDRALRLVEAGRAEAAEALVERADALRHAVPHDAATEPPYTRERVIKALERAVHDGP